MSDRYEIREQIGKGGLGAVFKAFDTQLQREVAIKRVLTTEHATQEEVEVAARKLIGEAQTLSSLNHPNIVSIFDVAMDEKGGFVVMELLNGETLDETVSRGVLTQEDFVEVVIQTMEALITAQASNVLHRDIKPTNVMVIWQASGRFQIKILDFGLAKFSKTPSVQTTDQDEAVMGSIFFMAPEQFERGELDARTDLYAMGCVYYHALTGQYPFRGETAPQVMHSHLQHRVTPLNKLRPDLAPSVCQWVMWLINRDKENRPEDARSALSRFPKNPEQETSAQAVYAIPVDETPTSVTTGVHVVAAPTHAAAPPSGLVRTHQTGALSPRSAARYNRPVGSGVSDSSASRKGPLIIAGVLLLAGLVAAGVLISGKMAEDANRITLMELSGQEKPQGDVTTVELGLNYLFGDSSSGDQKDQAKRLLSKLEGEGVDEKLLETLRRAATSYERITMSEILAARHTEKAVPDILDAFRKAESPNERLYILGYIRGLAGPAHARELMEALGDDYSLDIRKKLEDVLLAIYRQQPRSAEVLAPLLNRTSNTKGEERQSIFRILGSLGGKTVLTRLESIYERQDDQSLQRDAMSALLAWPDRGTLGLLDKIIKNTQDAPLKTAATRGYARIATQPAPVSADVLHKSWNRALEVAESSTERRKIMDGIADYASEENLKYLEQVSQEPKNKAFAEYAITEMKGYMAEARELKTDDLLPANPQALRGTDAKYNQELSAFVDWTSPDTYFLWYFKPLQSGTHGVDVIQAFSEYNVSHFEIIVAGKSLTGESGSGAGWDDFRVVGTKGSVKLQAGKVYTLILRATGVTSPRMMNVRGVRFSKGGGS